jgi:hypothetical protein
LFFRVLGTFATVWENNIAGDGRSVAKQLTNVANTNSKHVFLLQEVCKNYVSF